MSMTIHAVKTAGGIWVPASEADKEAQQPLKTGQPYEITVKESRNYAFHRKGMALLRFLFDHWEPGQIGHASEYRGVEIQKDFERFRKDLTILAGFYHPVWNVRGELRIEAESLSFGKMKEDRFRQVYAALVNVGWQGILKQVGYRSPEDVEQTLMQLGSFE